MKKLSSLLILAILLTQCGIIPKESSKVAKNQYNLSEYLLQNGYVKIQMEKEISGHLHLKGTINGIDANFILDTGASGTVIETKQKDKFKMESKDSEKIGAGAGGSSIQMEDSENNTIVIGDITIENQSLKLMNLDHVNNAFKSIGIKETDGVIGADILTDREAIIDYSNLILYLKKISK